MHIFESLLYSFVVFIMHCVKDETSCVFVVTVCTERSYKKMPDDDDDDDDDDDKLVFCCKRRKGNGEGRSLSPRVSSFTTYTQATPFLSNDLPI